MLCYMRTIKCQACGQPTQAKRKNTKYCGVCRLVNQLLYLRGRTRKCVVCNKKFALLEMSEQVCGNCQLQAQYEHPENPECGFCHRPRKPIQQEVAVCLPCAHAPANREAMTKAIIKKQQERANAEIA